MTDVTNDELGQRLSELTRWEGKPTGLWQRALRGALSSPHRERTTPRRLADWMLSPRRMGLAAVVCLFLTAVVVNLPHLGTIGERGMRNRSKARLRAAGNTVSELAGADSLKGVGHPMNIYSPTDLWPVVRSGAAAAARQFTTPSTTELPDASQDTSVWYAFLDDGPFSYSYQQPEKASGKPRESDPTTTASGGGVARPGMARQVVRKATIELKSDDVRAAFLKAQHLVQPALGEFVQDSAMSGTGNQSQAHLTLRVAAGRLSELLNQLRQAAEVVSEQQDGQDVTGQVVDVDARLRNEQKVETEILELLDSRADAPLAEILDMREKLAQVRTEIERLIAQRDRLGELVALATVLVIIRAEGAPIEQPASWGQYLGESVGGAWVSGARFLADTLATMLQILIGGMPFWVLLALGGWFIARRCKRSTE